MDTSLKQILFSGPEGVRLQEVQLYDLARDRPQESTFKSCDQIRIQQMNQIDLVHLVGFFCPIVGRQHSMAYSLSKLVIHVMYSGVHVVLISNNTTDQIS